MNRHYNMAKKYWLHRILGGSNAEPYATQLYFLPNVDSEGYISIGWCDFSDDSFASKVKAEGLDAINKRYDEEGWPHSRSMHCLKRFIHEMSKGDVVIVPMNGVFNICQIVDDRVLTNESIDATLIKNFDGQAAVIKERYLYAPNGKIIDMGFYRRVKRISSNIPRYLAPDDFKRRLRFLMTNTYCDDFSQYIESLIESKAIEESISKNIASMNNPLHFSDIIDDFTEEKVTQLTPATKRLIELPFSSFKLPEYQRTYKWQPVNVNQLINDIITFKGCSAYRLGTLVLHNSNIVDGQQRLVTISLIVAELQRISQIKDNPKYKAIFNSINAFLKRTSYAEQNAQQNVLFNIAAIKERREDLTEEFAQTLLEKCSFTVVRLPSIPEAFQFFDSQNARGKDLEPHDLLKAFHLREVGDENEIKNQNVETLIDDWQGIETSNLVDLFLCLYRVRQWSRGNSARSFEKNDTGCFKGITVHNGKKIYPSYLQAYYLSLLLSTYPLPGTDSKIDEGKFPFQIDGVILNGKRFFNMIMYYHALLKRVRTADSDLYSSCDTTTGRSAKNIIKLLSKYDTIYRVGDSYIRDLFDAILVYYVDKFGDAEIDKAVGKIFTFAYGLRLTNHRVSVATIDDAAAYNNVFKVIRDARTPEDFLNVFFSLDREMQNNRSKDLETMYNRIKLIG